MWPMLMKQDTHYRSAIHVEIQVSYITYKLSHGVNFLICSKLLQPINQHCHSCCMNLWKLPTSLSRS